MGSEMCIRDRRYIPLKASFSLPLAAVMRLLMRLGGVRMFVHWHGVCTRTGYPWCCAIGGKRRERRSQTEGQHTCEDNSHHDSCKNDRYSIVQIYLVQSHKRLYRKMVGMCLARQCAIFSVNITGRFHWGNLICLILVSALWETSVPRSSRITGLPHNGKGSHNGWINRYGMQGQGDSTHG